VPSISLSLSAADTTRADRVELCDNLNEGGTTPSLGAIVEAIQVNLIMLLLPLILL
jgi:copper homeostasis protein CutC